MKTTFLDLARERFAEELANATDHEVRGLAYSYLGLLDLPTGASPSWRWKLDMIRQECERRGRLDLFEAERTAVAVESARAGRNADRGSGWAPDVITEG